MMEPTVNPAASARAIDCHAHIVDPARFPYADGRGYKPRADETGPREAFRAVLDAHKVGHAVLVQPSCYGYDNSAMLDAVDREPGRYRAVAVVDPMARKGDLEALAERGVVGVRFNLVSYAADALADAEASGLIDHIVALGWFAQVYADDRQWPAAARILARSGVKVLVDHFGTRDPASAIGAPGFEAVLGLAREGRAAIKISAPFRLSRRSHDFADLAPIVGALVAAFGIENCIWGSDWPFLDVQGAMEYGTALAALSRLIPDGKLCRQVLWDNPVRLFGFAEQE